MDCAFMLYSQCCSPAGHFSELWYFPHGIRSKMASNSAVLKYLKKAIYLLLMVGNYLFFEYLCGSIQNGIQTRDRRDLLRFERSSYKLDSSTTTDHQRNASELIPLQSISPTQVSPEMSSPHSSRPWDIA